MNIKYLAYNLFKTDYTKLNKFITQLHQEKGVPKLLIYKDLIVHLFKWNTLFMDYFQNQFFDKTVDKTRYTNVWDMYLFQKKYNGKEQAIFRDKLQFRKRFSNYFMYPYFELKSKKDVSLLISWIKENGHEKIVAKKPLASSGIGVKVLKIELVNDQLLVEGQESENFLNTLYKNGYTLFESFIDQHLCLKRLHPASINTIRIVTFINALKEVEIWGATMRIGVNNQVDNFSMGGVCANIDLNSGIVNTRARFKAPFLENYEMHPVTGEKITGMKIPYWTETIKIIKRAALEVPEVRTVGWDLAMTPGGPTLIEGNDNWNKTNFELVTGIGLNERIKTLLS